MPGLPYFNTCPVVRIFGSRHLRGVCAGVSQIPGVRIVGRPHLKVCVAWGPWTVHFGGLQAGETTILNGFDFEWTLYALSCLAKHVLGHPDPRNCANTFDSDGILLIKARELNAPLDEPTTPDGICGKKRSDGQMEKHFSS